MRLIPIKLFVLFFTISSFQIANSQSYENNKHYPKGKLLKDLNHFIFFCQNKFEPIDYFQSDDIYIDYVKREFKKIEFENIEKYGNLIFISFNKNYKKRQIDFLSINLLLNNLNKKSGRISFYPYPINFKLSNSYYIDLLGEPIGFNQDSSSIFWVANPKGFFELRLNTSNLIFYTNDFEDYDFDFINNKEITTPIADRIIVDTLPKLPIFSNLMTELNSNGYFYKDNFFSEELEKRFGISVFKFCSQDINILLNEFVLNKRDMKEFNSAIDSLQDECFKKADLYRGSSIDIYDNQNKQDRRINQVSFRVACFQRMNDTIESHKKERIKNTLNYLIEKSKTEIFLHNSKKILTDFIDSIDINEDKTLSIKKENYLIDIFYNKHWLTVFITMPKSYIKN